MHGITTFNFKVVTYDGIATLLIFIRNKVVTYGGIATLNIFIRNYYFCSVRCGENLVNTNFFDYGTDIRTNYNNK
ncbi:hypothetical protein Hanom_Chr12g01117851 [Helianthus anomalus]